MNFKAKMQVCVRVNLLFCTAQTEDMSKQYSVLGLHEIFPHQHRNTCRHTVTLQDVPCQAASPLVNTNPVWGKQSPVEDSKGHGEIGQQVRIQPLIGQQTQPQAPWDCQQLLNNHANNSNCVFYKQKVTCNFPGILNDDNVVTNNITNPRDSILQCPVCQQPPPQAGLYKAANPCFHVEVRVALNTVEQEQQVSSCQQQCKYLLLLR